MLCSTRPLLRDWEGPLSSRIRNGSVVQDSRDKTYRFFWWEDGTRKSKALGRFPTKAKAWAAAKPYRDALEVISKPSAVRVSELVTHYRVEKMPQRASTRRGYES